MSTTIPKGSTVLVTGVSGYIGSWVADVLLEAGYKVRGSARTLEKGNKIKTILEKRHGTGKVEIVAVPSMEATGAFDEAVKGVSGIAHVASNLSFDSDPNKVIPEVIAGIKSILTSANGEKSVKRFVFTSSSTATSAAVANKKHTITPNTWNQADVDLAWGPDYPGKGTAVYGASKTEAERALWRFVEDNSPHFVCNAVLPNANFGPRIDPDQASTSAWVTNIAEGKTDFMNGIPPQWFVDVRDTARLHLAALTEEDVQNERIFAYSAPYNFRDIFVTLRKIRPDLKLPADPSGDDKDLSLVPARLRAEELLKRLGRAGGFIGFEECVAANVEGF